MDIWQKSVAFEFKSMDSEESDSPYFSFEGIATTPQVDRDNDSIAPGAFAGSLKSMTPAFCYQHSMQDPIGVFDSVKYVNGGTQLAIKGRMPKANSKVKDLISLIRMGALKAFSVGFRPDPDSISYSKDGTRVISKGDLYEISLVTMPSNPGAEMTSFKSVSPKMSLAIAPDSTSWDASSAIEDIREATGSMDSPSARYKDYFMYYDPSNADNFTAYKLPFAAKVGGTMKAVPRALSAIVAVLNGGRGGLDIPASDKAKVKARVMAYYKKMNKDNPFEEADGDGQQQDTMASDEKADMDDDEYYDDNSDENEESSMSGKSFYGYTEVKSLKSKREIEKCLRDSGAFSNKAAVYLASKIQLEKSVKSSDSTTEDVIYDLKQLLQEIKR